jgi:hypothetical protein
MDGGRARPFAFRISIRTLMLAIAGCTLPLTLAISSARQSRLTQEALARAIAAEQAAARAQAEAEQARVQLKKQPAKDASVVRTRHRDPKDAERLRQLYEEIEGLTRINESIQEDLLRLRARAMAKAKAQSAKGDKPPGAGAH